MIDKDKALGEPDAWIYPDDLDEMRNNETSCKVWSLAMSHPQRGNTVPLYAHPAAADLTAAHKRIAELEEGLRPFAYETAIAHAAGMETMRVKKPLAAFDKARALLENRNG